MPPVHHIGSLKKSGGDLHNRRSTPLQDAQGRDHQRRQQEAWGKQRDNSMKVV